MKNIPIGEILKQSGFITEDQLQKALEYQKQNPKKRLADILIELGFITEHQKLEALGQRLGISLQSLESYSVQLEAVGKIPKAMAIKYNLIPISLKDGRLTVAVNDPMNFFAIEDVRQLVRMPVELVLSELHEISYAIDYYYSEIHARQAVTNANTAAKPTAAPVITVVDPTEEAPIVKLLNSLLVRGFNTNASDIHIEPFESHVSVRIRVDGHLVDFVTLATNLHAPLMARIKILANIDIAEKRLPQDGHFRVQLEGNDMNVRVSLVPTVYGEKAVLRFLNPNTRIDHAGHFGMNERNYKLMHEMLQSPHGIVYMTGPTGSGKTTTLYMLLEYLAARSVNIMTIEDPVERNIPRINQIQVNNTAGLTFEAGLRSLLRQDPDIIMVGETRDAETAEISVRAAITGHLVLSTLHTNDAISSIVRLMDMGVPSYLIASSLIGITAQRLLRKICPDCTEEYVPDAAERQILGVDVQSLKRGRGCNACNQTGYRGRIAIHEMALIDRAVRNFIADKAPMEEILQYVVSHQGMRTLRQEATDLVLAGVTTVSELVKTAYTR